MKQSMRDGIEERARTRAASNERLLRERLQPPPAHVQQWQPRCLQHQEPHYFAAPSSTAFGLVRGQGVSGSAEQFVTSESALDAMRATTLAACEDCPFRRQCRDAFATIDELLRGATAEQQQLRLDPTATQCRLCKQKLTGNALVDELAVTNARLVQAMDFAWATCERFHDVKTELHEKVHAKRQEVRELRELLEQLRTEYPAQVQGYIMRTIAPSRERLLHLRHELDGLRSEGDRFADYWADVALPSGYCAAGKASAAGGVLGDGSTGGLCGSAGVVADTAEAHGERLPDDKEWARFRLSVDSRIAQCLARTTAAASPPRVRPHTDEPRAGVVLAGSRGDFLGARPSLPASEPVMAPAFSATRGAKPLAAVAATPLGAPQACPYLAAHVGCTVHDFR